MSQGGPSHLSPNKVNNEMFYLLGGFAFTTVFRATPEWGCCAAVIHFWLVPAYHTDPFGKRMQEIIGHRGHEGSGVTKREQ